MNILIVSPFSIYERFESSYVHNQVIEYQRLGHNVRVVLGHPLGKKDWEGRRAFPLCSTRRIDGIEVFLFRYFSLSNKGEFSFNDRSMRFFLNRKLKKVLKDFKPDIIHSHTFDRGGSLGAFLKEKLGLPLVLTTHGTDLVRPFSQGKINELKRVGGIVDKIICVSSKLKEILDKLDLGEKTEIIINGYKKIEFDRIEKKAYSILQVGNLISQKNNDKTILGFSKILKDYPKASLKIIGNGPEEENLKELVKSLNIEDRVSFLGRLKNSEVLECMARTQVYIMPSENEGFGIVYLEAMSQACLTIASKGEGIGDILLDGVNGILLDPRDINMIAEKMNWAFENIKKARIIAHEGYELSKKYTWEENAKKYLVEFASLLNKYRS